MSSERISMHVAWTLVLSIQYRWSFKENSFLEGRLTVHLPHEIKRNASLMQLDNFILSSTCFGYIRPSSGALDVVLQHIVFCTEFLDGWCSLKPLRQKTVCCDTTSTAPDVWAHVPEICRAKITLIKLPFCTKLAFQVISVVVCL